MLMQLRSSSSRLFRVDGLCASLACVAALAAASVAAAAGESPASAPATRAVPVRIVQRDGAFQLFRGGQPYFICGAGGQEHLDVLAAAGGNSIRTWSTDGLGEVLDRAGKLGLTVTAGIWIGHEQHGFKYTSVDAVAGQIAAVRKAVLQYRDHPALLMWALGNEMEGTGDSAAMWSALNNLASLAHRLDPNHPTMTVIAELGGNKVRNLHLLCPDIDVVGINSYGGIGSVAERYRKAGGTKPYVVTEFGPVGHWEVGKTAWGAPIEQTSTTKAEFCRQNYAKAIASQKGFCLGSYVFLWGHKQEATATWYGMFLPDGSRLEIVDAMQEMWTGKPPANRCPRLALPMLSGGAGADKATFKPGETFTAKLDLPAGGKQAGANDPDRDKLTVRWVLRSETGQYATGGDAQSAAGEYADAVVKSDATFAEVRAPKDGGGYRLFAYVSDGHGGAAVANVPLYVDGPLPVFKPPVAKLPLVLYADGVVAMPYPPTGWMGKMEAIAVDDKCPDNPHAGKTCMKVTFSSPDNWGGVVWQSPGEDWGNKPGGFDLRAAKSLTFWARGEKGGEVVSFKLGLLGKDKKFHDSDSAALEKVELTTEWKKYTIDLAGKDLTCIKTGFAWTLAGQGKTVTFFLDDVQYE
jgi:exo-beta-1,3-glucanase (GH17 family)